MKSETVRQQLATLSAVPRAPLSLLALLGGAGALVSTAKRKKGEGLTEAQRRVGQVSDLPNGAGAKIDRMEAAEAAAIAAAQEAKRKTDEPLDSAAQSYMAWGKAIEDGKFDTQRYAEEMEKFSHEPACTPENVQKPKTWWQRAGDSIHGIISALPNIVDGVNAGFEIISTTRAFRQVSYEQIGNQIIMRGPRSARQALGLNPYTNRINLENAPRLLAENPPTRSFRSVSSGWTLAGILLNAGVDCYSYKTGEYDQQEFGAALLFDTSATIISAAVGGFVAGAVAGAIAGSPALGIDAIPGAAIGGVVGAIAGIGASLALNYYVKDWYISTASHGWDWLGQ